jgi:hypothetical protein
MATPQELAQQIVDRNAQAKALMAEMETQARNAASARLAPYGDTLSMYEDRFNEVYNPQMVRGMGQLNAAQQYATGLGDLLVRRAREARSGKSTIDPNSGQSPITLEQLLAFFTPKPATNMMVGSADANERRMEQQRRANLPRGPVASYGSADAQERRLG